MAIGLRFLRARGMRWTAAVLHLTGAAIGGAVIGGGLGAIGTWLSLSHWRPWVISGATIAAIWFGLGSRHVRFSAGRQVPRGWSTWMPPQLRFALWGVLLGSGVATLIPHSAFLLLVGSQLTGGVGLGILSGAVFGLARQSVVLVLLLAGLSPVQAMAMPLTLHMSAHHLNLAVIMAGVLLLLIA